MESWRKVWRDGVEPLLSLGSLEALRNGLANDDPRLLQGATTTPPPLQCVQEWPVEAACVLGYWRLGGRRPGDGGGGRGILRPGCSFEVDQRLGEPAGCRWFLNWYDETPRDEMRQLLLAESRPRFRSQTPGRGRRRRGGRERRERRGLIPKTRTHSPEERTMMCRHCQRVRSNRPRGLCWSCYYTPGVREKYPSTSKYARRGVSDLNGPACGGGPADRRRAGDAREGGRVGGARPAGAVAAGIRLMR